MSTWGATSAKATKQASPARRVSLLLSHGGSHESALLLQRGAVVGRFHYRIREEQSPAAVAAAVAKEWRAAPRRRLLLFAHCDHADGRARAIAPGAEGLADAVEKSSSAAVQLAPATRLVHPRAEAVVRQSRRDN